MAKTLEELQALENRLTNDVRRSRALQPDGLTRNTPLIRNLEQVRHDIQNFTPPSTTSEVISE